MQGLHAEQLLAYFSTCRRQPADHVTDLHESVCGFMQKAANTTLELHVYCVNVGMQCFAARCNTKPAYLKSFSLLWDVGTPPGAPPFPLAPAAPAFPAAAAAVP